MNSLDEVLNTIESITKDKTKVNWEQNLEIEDLTDKQKEELNESLLAEVIKRLKG